jgi:hypothetical protein
VIDERNQDFQTKIDALEGRILAQQGSLDTQLTSHTDAFNASQRENAARVQAELDAFSEKSEEQLTDADTRVTTRVAEVEKIASDVGVLAGAISLKETASYCEEEANAQRTAANWLRGLTVLVACGAVAAGVWAVLRHAGDTHTLIAKLAVSGVLGGLATYTATQSGRHRAREVRAKDLQLQLTAFSPFIAPLAPELQQLERVRMTRHTFGIAIGGDVEDEEYGPTFLNAIRALLSGKSDDTETPAP